MEEKQGDGEHPWAATWRLALEKAYAVVAAASSNQVVVGADTSVVLDGRMYGKPIGETDACRMLLELAGRSHRVVTAWAAVGAENGGGRRLLSGFSTSTVRMREVEPAEARAYARSGEPLDKAGAYAVQGRGRALVAAVEGSRDNVIGLPTRQVACALERLGVFPAPGAGERR